MMWLLEVPDRITHMVLGAAMEKTESGEDGGTFSPFWSSFVGFSFDKTLLLQCRKIFCERRLFANRRAASLETGIGR
jgi:hypothetical protein